MASMEISLSPDSSRILIFERFGGNHRRVTDPNNVIGMSENTAIIR